MGHPRKLRGYALMMAIALMATLFLLGLALVHFMTAQRSLLRKAEDISLAREASRAGVDFALAQLRSDPTWRQGFARLSPLPGTVGDMHLETCDGQPRLRYRIDGVLNDFPAPPGGVYPALISRIKILANLDIYYETRLDFAFRSFARLVEPCLILTVGFLIGTIVLALGLPFMNLVAVLR